MYLRHIYLLEDKHNTFITPNKLTTVIPYYYLIPSPYSLFPTCPQDVFCSWFIQIRIQARTTRWKCFVYWRNQVTCLVGLPDFAHVMSLDEFLYPAVSHRLVVELEARADSGFVFWTRVLDRWCWVLLTVLHQWAQVVWLAHFQVMWWISGCRYCQADPSIGHFPFCLSPVG